MAETQIYRLAAQPQDENTPPVSVYLEHSARPENGGFTIPLPTTAETLKPWLKAMDANIQDVAVREVKSPVAGLLNFFPQGATFDELNYLAAKISPMDEQGRAILGALGEIGRHFESIESLINVTENLDCFELLDISSSEALGEYYLNKAEAGQWISTDSCTDPDWATFMSYSISNSERDAESCGKWIWDKTDSAFTGNGFLLARSGIKEIYPGRGGIPDAYRITAKLEEEHLREESLISAAVCNVMLYHEQGETLSDTNMREIFFPAVRASIPPFLSAIDIDGLRYKEISVEEVWLSLPGFKSQQVYLPGNTALDELNFLSAKLKQLNSGELKIFAAAAAKFHCGSAAEMINLAENINMFDLCPARDAFQYGKYLLENEANSHDSAMQALWGSGRDELINLASYIETLESYVDLESYGRKAAEKENGAFTEYGYIAETGDFKTAYRSLADIPIESRIYETAPLIVRNVDASQLLMEMHALCGDYMRDAKYSIEILGKLGKGGGTFFIIISPNTLQMFPANLIYSRDTAEHEAFMAEAKTPELRAFILSASDCGGKVSGCIYETSLDFIQDSVRENSFSLISLDTETEDGSKRSVSIEGRATMDACGCDQLKRGNTDDEAKLAVHLHYMRGLCEKYCSPVTARQFLVSLNKPFMARAKSPHPEMLRINIDAAKEILARDASPVYNLLQSGPEKLFPLDSIKTRLWDQAEREFAVRQRDLPGIENWAQREAGEILRQAERGNRRKNLSEEL